jgi:hypothetical protein
MPLYQFELCQLFQVTLAVHFSYYYTFFSYYTHQKIFRMWESIRSTVVPVTPPRSQSLLIISTIVMVVPLLVPHQVKNCKISPLEHAYVQTIQNVPGFCIRWNRIRFHIRTYILTVCTHQKFFFLKDKRKKKKQQLYFRWKPFQHIQ